MKNQTLKTALKRVFFMAMTMTFGLGLNAQTLTASSVPAKARQSLKSSVPTASATWSAGPNTTYEAKFDNRGQTLVYVFDKNGLLNEKKQLCKLGGLPLQISTSMASAYPGVEHQAAYKVITRQRQRFFEVVIPGRGTLDYMRFDVAGTPVGKSSLALAEQPEPTRIAAAQQNELGLATETTEPAYNSMPMRGESSNTIVNTEVDLSDEINIEAELMDDDLKDLLDDGDEQSMDDLLNQGDDDDWEEIDLFEDLEDDDDWEDIDPFD